MINLMIVDDEPASIYLIKAFLDFEFLEAGVVTEATGGFEAMKLIQSGNIPQIVISDMEMPIVGGIQFLNFIADCHPEIKTIVVSGYFDFRYTHAAITAGAKDYILKPVDPDKLRNAVRNCVEAIRREEQLPSVAVAGLELDTGTYKAILKKSEQLRVLLESGNFHCIRDELEKLRQLVCASNYREAAELFTARLFYHVLQYYCVAHEYGFSASNSAMLKIDNDIHTIFALTQLYEATLSHIQEEKHKQDIEVILEKIKNYIDANCRLPLRLDGIAASYHVNKEYMNTSFRRKYGVTIGAYILKVKMEESLQLLENQDISIGSIARMVGYEDPTYFNRVFKKYTGCSPGKYREVRNKSPL
jgi:two-component system response regulator YesN